MDSKNVTTTQQVPATDNNLGGTFSGLLPIVLICVLFYFLIMRPQQKREAKKKEKMNQLKRGDLVLTNGGIVGKIDKVVSDTEIALEISDGVIVKLYKNFIADTLDSSVGLLPPAVKETKKGKTTRNVKKEEKVAPDSSETK